MASVTLCVFVCVRALEENNLNYQHQTWYTHNALWQSLGMHWPGGQKIKGQAHAVTRTVTVAWLLGLVSSEVCCFCRSETARRMIGFWLFQTFEPKRKLFAFKKNADDKTGKKRYKHAFFLQDKIRFNVGNNYDLILIERRTLN